MKLDLGCGAKCADGFVGVDCMPFPGVEVVVRDLGVYPWPWPDASIDEVRCSHMLEHLDQLGRMHFFRELWRVLKPGAVAMIQTPHWASGRALGDPTHQWPPVSEESYSYLDRKWRSTEAPYLCSGVLDLGAVDFVDPQFNHLWMDPKSECAYPPDDLVVVLTK